MFSNFSFFSFLIINYFMMGCILIRHGGKHDWYQNPKTRVSQPVPRHNEIRDFLARHILKMMSE